jgi:MYXO-CTERM domain-containing protein
MPKRKIRFAWLWLSVLVCALSSTTVQAGPVELLDGVTINPADPDNIVVTYLHGGSGLFVSEDGGATLKWLCSVGASLPSSNASLVSYASGDGSIYVGSYHGLWRGDKSGCGFAPLPELEKKYVRAITGDPFEPTRTYFVTSNPMADNGIYMNDGSGSFSPLGTHARLFLASLHVVKNDEARRFYETGVLTNAETNTVTYSVRVSDDDGTTWVEHTFDPTLFETTEKRVQDFKVMAVDPTNPDRVVGLVIRPDKAADQLVFSHEQGKAGTWELVASPVVGGAVAFGPDGVLYFGDDNFASKGVFAVPQLGEQPKLLSDVYRVSCLGYDNARSRLLGCADNYRFGTFDTSSGELATLLDLRCAEHTVTCADKPDIQALCQPPSVEFCKIDHWVIAPLCCVYERDQLDTFAASQGVVCEGGVAKSKPSAAGEGGAQATPPVCPRPTAGSGGAAGASGVVAASGGASAAGSGATVGSAGGSGSGSGGCGCSSVGQTAPERAALLALLGLVVLYWRRARFTRG